MARSLNDVLRPVVHAKEKEKVIPPNVRGNVTQATSEAPQRSVSGEAGIVKSKQQKRNGHISTTAKGRVRKERSDKKKDIKFPVTPDQRNELRRRASEMRIENREPGVKYETISNTSLLKKAMEQFSIFPERYPPLVYKDTGQYMHAEPVLRDHEQIEALARRWNLSYRQTVYRLIMNYIFVGEVNLDANRKQQK